MAVSYKKLWKLLIDRDMKKKDLAVVTEMHKQKAGSNPAEENVTETSDAPAFFASANGEKT